MFCQNEPEGQEANEQGNYTALDTAVDTLTISFAAPIMELVGAIKCILRGDFWGLRSVKFRIPLCADWPAGAVLGVLGHHRIDVYEYGAAYGYQFVIVDRDDGKKTEYVLNTYGVPHDQM